MNSKIVFTIIILLLLFLQLSQSQSQTKENNKPKKRKTVGRRLHEETIDFEKIKQQSIFFIYFNNHPKPTILFFLTFYSHLSYTYVFPIQNPKKKNGNSFYKTKDRHREMHREHTEKLNAKQQAYIQRKDENGGVTSIFDQIGYVFILFNPFISVLFLSWHLSFYFIFFIFAVLFL